jgi:dihydrolipoamide dehydrogenase
MSLIEIKVPDIGDFSEVAVIELLVKPGDTIKAEQSLITVESDKASMEIPSSHAGVVKELKVKLGDKVAEGSVVLLLEASGAASAAPAAPAAPVSEQKQPSPSASGSQALSVLNHLPPPSQPAFGGSADLECDVLVLGGGPGGYSAAFRAADLGLKVVIVERYATLGGVCLNVGCIPSKALLHVAAVMDEVSHLADLGGLRCARGQHRQAARPQGKGHRQAHRRPGRHGQDAQGDHRARLRPFRRCQPRRGGRNHRHRPRRRPAPRRWSHSSAPSSRPARRPCACPSCPTTRAWWTPPARLALKEVPKRMLILGGGIIGLEMGTVYSTLGARLDVVEMMDGLMQGADRDLVKIWQKMNAKRFDNIMLKTKTVSARALPEGIEVTFAPAEEGGTAPAPQLYDLVLQAVGRTPNGKKIAADKAGVAVTDRGFINVDIQMRTNVPHIFAIGDIVGQPMLAHKAVHEAHVAAEVIAGELKGDKELASAAFNARVIPSVAYTDPEVAWVGLTEDQAKAQGIKVKKGLFPWTASGRAIANGRDEGVTKLLFDDSPEAHGHGKILGGGMVGTHAGDMIGEIALAIEMGADAVDIGKTIHPHPTLGESIGMAAEVAHGSCTDVPPARK